MELVVLRLLITRRCTGYLFLLTALSRSVLPYATYQRQLKKKTETVRESLLAFIRSPTSCPILHWVDNFDKLYVANAVYVNKSLYRSMRWTAHAVKKLSPTVSMVWSRGESGAPIPALPALDDLLSSSHDEDLLRDLASLKRLTYDSSVTVWRKTCRVPLKPKPLDAFELDHLSSSSDGLGPLHPIDLYKDNIVSTEGLIKVLHRLHTLSGFGDPLHPRAGQYSLLHCDVAIFWQLLLLLYSFSGMAPLRHDLFLIFGFWHAYQYAHIAAWDTFRTTFLADAFFALYPDQKLLSRPKLVLSSTFFTWLRLSYPHFRPQLSNALARAAADLVASDLKHCQAVGKRKSAGSNRLCPERSKYIHLYNLQTLFEFVIPTIQDYGTSPKLTTGMASCPASVTFSLSLRCAGRRAVRIISGPCTTSSPWSTTGHGINSL